MDLQALIAQRAAIDAQIAATQAEGKANAIAEIKRIMADAGITLADMGNAKAAKSPVAAKYRNAKGQTWAGRGKRPVWLQTALAAGSSLEEFAAA